jgi:hypothetical protein
MCEEKESILLLFPTPPYVSSAPLINSAKTSFPDLASIAVKSACSSLNF